MTGPEGTREQPVVEPSVTTAPAPGQPHSWWSAIPEHLGRARTSTVVLALLFVAIGALYLTVRPDPVVAAGSTSTIAPAQRTGGGAGTTATPTPAPTTTPSTTPTTTPTPTSDSPTPSDLPTTSSLPGETTTQSVPTTTGTTTEAPLPTTATPTG